MPEDVTYIEGANPTHADAGQILDRLTERGWGWKVEHDTMFNRSHFTARFSKDGVSIYEGGDTAPEAVCKAYAKLARLIA